MSSRKVMERAAPVAANVINTSKPTQPSHFTGKVGLVTGGSKEVGLQVGISLAKRFAEQSRESNSRIYLTTKYEEDIPELTEKLFADYDPEIAERIEFAQLDLLDKGSLFKLYRKIKDEAMTLDLLVNNAQRFTLPSQANDERFKDQCEKTLQVNYEGMKKICKTFTPMLNQHGRIVLCSSHLGHLSNIDGREPAASLLRDRFADKDLTEEKLDWLVKEFQDHVASGNGEWVQNGWPSCPFTVSKIAVNAFTRILQTRLDSFHSQKYLVVNAVHHGCNHRLMNTGYGFPQQEAGEFVAGLATLPEHTHLRGKIVWRDFESFDNWQYGGLDDDNKQSKAFCAIYEMEKDGERLHDINTGFCLSG